MSNLPESERTEQYGRNAQAFSCTRRRFLPALLREAIVTLGMLRGGEGGRLSELTSLPDERLADITPVLNPAFAIEAEGEKVWARYLETGATVPLFAADDDAAWMTFNLFDGRHTIQEAGIRLADRMGWDKDAGFAHAKDLFLQLVENLVCVPKDPPLPAERRS